MFRLISRGLRRLIKLTLVIIILVLAVLGVIGRNEVDGHIERTGPVSSSEIGDAVEVNDGSELDGYVTSFAADVYPDYYRVIGTATTVREGREDGIAYGPLDDHGRATGASGWISGAMRAEARAKGRVREDLPDPAGWPDENPEVDIPGAKGRHDYHGWLWNRSHLVAASLGGEPVAENLVAGTRTQNVGDNVRPGGMAYTETLARDWLDAHAHGRLWYAVTPIYEGDEPIPRAVIVDIATDDGEIDQKVMVYNAANGFDIDYRTGESRSGMVF